MHFKKRRFIAWALFFSMLLSNIFSYQEKTYANEMGLTVAEDYDGGSGGNENTGGDTDENPDDGQDTALPSTSDEDDNSENSPEEEDSSGNQDNRENNDGNIEEMPEEPEEEKEEELEKASKEALKNKMPQMTTDFDPDMLEMILSADKTEVLSGERIQLLLDLSFSSLEEDYDFRGLEFRFYLPEGMQYDKTQEFLSFRESYHLEENYISFTIVDMPDTLTYPLPVQVYFPAGLSPSQTGDVTVDLFDRHGERLTDLYGPALRNSVTINATATHGWYYYTSNSKTIYSHYPTDSNDVAAVPQLNISFSSFNKHYEDIMTLGIHHTEEAIILGSIYIPANVTFESADITDGTGIVYPEAFLSPGEIIHINPHEINAGSSFKYGVPDKAIAYQEYEVYMNPDFKGIVKTNPAPAEKDLENNQFSVQLYNLFIPLNEENQVTDNTYANGIMIYTDGSYAYKPYGQEYQAFNNIYKSYYNYAFYRPDIFRPYETAVTSGLTKTTSRTVLDYPIWIGNTSLLIPFSIKDFSNPYVLEKTGAGSYYAQEYLYNYILEDSRATTQTEFPDNNIFDYAMPYAISPGTYNIRDNNMKSEYRDLTYDIEYEKDGAWHKLATLNVFTVSGENISSKSHNSITLSGAAYRNVTGIRFVFSNGVKGLPPSFEVRSAPAIHFKMKTDVDVQKLAFDANGFADLYNTAVISYHRPETDSFGNEVSEGGKPVLREETTVKSSSGLKVSRNNYAYTISGKTAQNLTKPTDKNVYKIGDSVRYTLNVSSKTASKQDIPLTNFTVVDWADTKMLAGFIGQDIPYQVKIGSLDITAITHLEIAEAEKDGSNQPTLTFTFDPCSHVIMPGTNLTITYEVTIPPMEIPEGYVPVTNRFEFYLGEPHDHLPGDYCICGVKNEGDNSCTIHVYGNYPGLGVRKNIIRDSNHYVVRPGDVIHIEVEAVHYNDVFDNDGEDLLVVLGERFSNYGYYFDEAGAALFENSFKVRINGAPLPSDQYIYAKRNFDTRSDAPEYSVAVPAALFAEGDVLTIHYSMPIGPAGTGYGHVNFGAYSANTYTNNVYLLLYDQKDKCFVSTDDYFYETGEYATGSISKNQYIYHNVGNGPVYQRGLTGFYKSFALTVSKTPNVIGLTNTVINAGIDENANQYVIDYETRIDNFSRNDVLAIPAGSLKIVDILPLGQTMNDTAALKICGPDGSVTASYTLQPNIIGTLDGRDIVTLLYTGSGKVNIPGGGYALFEYQAAGDLSVYQNRSARMQNWVAFQPNLDFTLNFEPGYGAIENIRSANPYLFTLNSSVSTSSFYLSNYSVIELEKPFIEPAVTVNVFQYDSNEVYRPTDPMEIHPDTTVSWRIQVDNRPNATANIKGFEVVAVLPGSFSFQEPLEIWDSTTDSWQSLQNHGSIGKIETRADGRQYVPIAITDEIAAGGFIQLKMNTNIPMDYFGSDYCYVYAIPGNNGAFQPDNVRGGKYLDAEQSNKAFGRPVYSISAFTPINIYGFYGLQAQLSAATAGNNVNAHEILTVGYGETFTYRLKVESAGDYSFQDLVLADVLPHVGDTGVKLVNQPRNSNWAPINIENLQVFLNGSNMAAAEIRFSDKNNILPEDWQPAPAGGSWYETPQPTTQAIRIFIPGAALAPGDTIEVTFDMTAPAEKEKGIAWNSFAFETLPYKQGATVGARIKAEPVKTGVTLPCATLIIEKEIINPPEEKSTFTFEIKGGGSTQTAAIQGEDSVTLNLAPGSYTITEQKTDGYTLQGFNGTAQQSLTFSLNEEDAVTVTAVNIWDEEEPDIPDGGGENGGEDNNGNENGGGNNGGASGGNSGNGSGNTLSPAEMPEALAPETDPLLRLGADNLPLGDLGLLPQEETALWLDEDQIPAGSAGYDKQNPKTGDDTRPSYWIMLLSLGYLSLSYLKQKRERLHR